MVYALDTNKTTSNKRAEEKSGMDPPQWWGATFNIDGLTKEQLGQMGCGEVLRDSMGNVVHLFLGP